MCDFPSQLVQQKTKKEEHKRQKEALEVQKQKESNDKLKQLKQAAVKRQIEYKGLHKPTKALATPSQTPQSSKSTPSSSIKSSKSSKPLPNGVSKSKPSGATSKPSSSSIKDTSKSKPSPVSKRKPTTKPTAAVVNFNDLMKMAKGKREGTNQTDYPPRTSSSPLGKSLLEKKSAKSKPNPPRPPTKGGASQTSYRVPISPMKTVSVDITRHPCSPTSSQGHKKLNGHSVKNGRSQPSPSKPTRDSNISRPPLKSGVRTGKVNPDLAARKAALQRRKLKASQPTSFYGSAAANILGRKDGASSGSGQFRYTSTWVDEMREELEDFDGLDDLSDDEDLDDFVVDSGDDFIDDGDQEDYSSHIRKIFGYDKRK